MKPRERILDAKHDLAPAEEGVFLHVSTAGEDGLPVRERWEGIVRDPGSAGEELARIHEQVERTEWEVSAEELRQLVSAKEREISRHFSQAKNGPLRLVPKRDNGLPHVQALAAILDHLQTLRRLLDRENPELLEKDPRLFERLRGHLNARGNGRLATEDAWQIATTLRIELLSLSDANRLRSLALEELALHRPGHPPLVAREESADSPGRVETVAGWRLRQELLRFTGLGGRRPFPAQEGPPAEPFSPAQVRLLLEQLYLLEARRERQARLTLGLRAGLLDSFWMLLLALGAGLILSRDPELTAAAAGGMGALLGRILRMRGRLSLATGGPIWRLTLAQAAGGAVLGLLTSFLFQSGAILLGAWSGTLPGFALLGGLAGFLEPFTLRFLERLGFVAGKPHA